MIGKQVDCLGNGFVRLVDAMPREEGAGDAAIVQAARVSYGLGTKIPKEDRDLIRYLLRHRHTTPLEMCEFKFHCKMPIFIARQWIRHRTANVNEISGRYSELPNEFYFPSADNVRTQSKTNKQGTDAPIDAAIAQEFIEDLEDTAKASYALYEGFIESGIAKELARMILPLNLMTEWYWKIDLHNLLHFLSLRCDSHAQREIQVYGNAMLELVKPFVPWTIEAWEDYHPLRNAMLLTAIEIQALQNWINDLPLEEINKLMPIATENKREQNEWKVKAEKLGVKL